MKVRNTCSFVVVVVIISMDFVFSGDDCGGDFRLWCNEGARLIFCCGCHDGVVDGANNFGGVCLEK